MNWKLLINCYFASYSIELDFKLRKNILIDIFQYPGHDPMDPMVMYW